MCGLETLQKEIALDRMFVHGHFFCTCHELTIPLTSAVMAYAKFRFDYFCTAVQW